MHLFYDATEISVSHFAKDGMLLKLLYEYYSSSSSEEQQTLGWDVSKVSAERLPLAQSLRPQI